MYSNDVLYLQVNGELCKPLYLSRGLKQGCNLSPLFFNIMMVQVAKRLQATGLGGKVGKLRLPCVLFADDIGLSSETREGLEQLIEILQEEGKKFGMTISKKKSKVMGLIHGDYPLVMKKPLHLDTVASFKYLGLGM